MTQQPQATTDRTDPSGTQARTAVVTGASSGIGRATALHLARDGWTVYAVARREDRLQDLLTEAEGLPGTIVPLVADVTDRAQVDAVREQVEAGGGADTLLNIAGGALGTDSIATGDVQEWEWMYRANVLGTLHTLQAFLPMLRATGHGTVLNLTSVAAEVSYEGGGGYNAAKMGQQGLTGALRLEEAEHNVRVIEIAPGLVHTEEFSLNRLRGDQAAADKVYAGVEKPLTAGDVADLCAYAVNAPHHVNLDRVIIKPVAQAAVHKMIRQG